MQVYFDNAATTPMDIQVIDKMTEVMKDVDFKVFSSTQHPSETQQIISKMLNQESNTITVETRRIGGGFGGKETQSFIFAAICTLLAKKTKRPVKLKMDRDDDIIITGKRHDFYSEYEVGFDELGVIKGLKLKLIGSFNCWAAWLVCDFVPCP